jgi:hypothetical protein
MTFFDLVAQDVVNQIADLTDFRNVQGAIDPL